MRASNYCLTPIVLSAALLGGATILHGATVVHFDQFNDGDLLTNQIAGLEFSDAVVLTAGISLNEFEFPPHSGTNVASDFGGPLTIVFSSPITEFQGYFTYTVALNLSAFNIANSKVASIVSLFSNNEALSGVAGSSPNELLELSSAQGFSKVVLSGDPAGGSFVVDDISFGFKSGSAVPEPSWVPVLMLLAVGAGFCAGRRRW